MAVKTGNVRTFSKNSELVAERREQIAREAAHLFLERGYQKSNVREIASVCKMAMGTLYHYIGSKEDVLRLVIDYTLSALKEYYSEVFADLEKENPEEMLKRGIEEYYLVRTKYEDFVNLWYLEARNLPRDTRKIVFDSDRETIAYFEKVLKRGCETGHFKIDDITLVAHSIVVLGHMWSVRNWFLRKHYTLEEYTQRMSAFVFKAVRAQTT